MSDIKSYTWDIPGGDPIRGVTPTAKVVELNTSLPLIDGTTEIEEYLDFDADKMLTLPGEATFNWKSPPPFIGEVERLLGLLYYLYLEHTELPEWVLGNAITGSRASAETQVEIERKGSARLSRSTGSGRRFLGFAAPSSRR